MEDKNDLLRELIDVLNRMNPDHINGCVILHYDKETKKLKSISPMVSAASIKELYEQLSDARNGIQNLLNDLVDKGLHKN